MFTCLKRHLEASSFIAAEALATARGGGGEEQWWIRNLPRSLRKSTFCNAMQKVRSVRKIPKVIEEWYGRAGWREKENAFWNQSSKK